MASFSYSVEIPLPPAEVFPWLLEEDKVPQWTGNLESYSQVDGTLGEGSHVRQVLEISGRRIDVELEITSYDPPNGAETVFSTNGIEVVNAYALEATGGGTRLTQSVDAKPSGLTARMLVPIIQPRLEQKLTEDLERLRELCAPSLISLAALLVFSPAALAQSPVDDAIDALQNDTVYVDPNGPQGLRRRSRTPTATRSTRAGAATSRSSPSLPSERGRLGRSASARSVTASARPAPTRSRGQPLPRRRLVRARDAATEAFAAHGSDGPQTSCATSSTAWRGGDSGGARRRRRRRPASAR